MAKEINFFEQQMETTASELVPQLPSEDLPPSPPEKLTAPKAFSPKKQYVQGSLPGIPVNNQAIEQKATEKTTRTRLKRIIEALLFVSREPLSFNKIREVLDAVEPLKPRQIQDLLQELAEEFILQQRAFRLEEIAQGYILRTCKEYSPYLDLLFRNKRTEKLSPAAAEVLAIIAYRQPITRPQIDAIRGVDSSGTLQSLLERQLVESVGRLEAPGRPTLYGITSYFLKHFGLRDLKELPGWQPPVES
jgi:segregation and condensation protein B